MLPEPVGDVGCRKCWCAYYGFSHYAVDDCARQIKLEWSTTGKVGSAFNDSTQFDFTFDAARDMIARNITDGKELIGHAGKLYRENFARCSALIDVSIPYFCVRACADPEMIVAGLTPYADLQTDAVLWLQRYFLNFADHSPNSELSHISVSAKHEVHKDYLKDQQAISRPILNRKRFLQLWAAVFPYCELRSFVDIPGKCKTCCCIDIKRRKGGSFAEMHACQLLHFMHRGGMFMKERLE